MGTSKLKMILCERDISIKELAAATGINYQTCVSIVNGRRPTRDHASDIADALNCRVSKLFPDLDNYGNLRRKMSSR